MQCRVLLLFLRAPVCRHSELFLIRCKPIAGALNLSRMWPATTS
jgi:hypothetical protein